MKIGAKAKPKADATKERDDEQVDETPPAASHKRARPAPKLRRPKIDDDDGSSAAHGGTCSAELEEHVKREKKQEKTLDQDIHHLHDEIKRLRQCIQQLESQAKEKKEPSSAEGQAMPALVSLLQGLIAWTHFGRPHGAGATSHPSVSRAHPAASFNSGHTTAYVWPCGATWASEWRLLCVLPATGVAGTDARPHKRL